MGVIEENQRSGQTGYLPAHHGTALAWVSTLHRTFNKWDQLRMGTKLHMAEQAINAGIADLLPLVTAADNGGNRETDEWRRTVESADIPTTPFKTTSDHLTQIDINRHTDFVVHAGIKKLKLMVA